MKRLVLFICVLGIGLIFTGFDWPVDEPKALVGFGQRYQGDLIPGMILGTSGPTVKVPHPGRVVYTLDPRRHGGLTLPSSLGAVIAMDHLDADNKYSLRTALAGLPNLPDIKKTEVQRGDPITSLVLSGDKPGAQVKLFVFDLSDKTVVNPWLFYPSMKDTTAPLVKDFRLELDQRPGPRTPVLDRMMIPADYWRILAEITDSQDDQAGALGFQSVRVFQGGSDIFHLELSALESRQGKLYVPGQSEPYLFQHPEDKIWRLGKPFINAGTNTMEVEVKDMAGNTTTRTFSLVGTR